DENVRSASLRLWNEQVDLFMAYSRVVDHASHRSWRYYDDTDFPDRAKATHRELLDGVVPAAYRFVDHFLGDLMDRCGEDVNIVVVSDHGFGSATGEYMIPEKRLARVLTGSHRYDGILLGAGPDFREGVYEHVSLMDVAPLLLTLLDVPISAELPGRVPVEMLRRRLFGRGSAETVERYGSTWRFVDTPPADAEADRRALERLQALGYVDSAARAGRSDAGAVEDLWAGDGNLRLRILSGELLFLLMRGRTAEAEELMTLLTVRDPEAAKAMPFYAISEAKRVEEHFAFGVFGQGSVAEFLRPWVRR
ncbi:MAG: alkaline phosphatase family protein, partial [Planctomycetota bacterium]|nr:alkaline phosphatase family protein [Planctomycetota bacterium]